MRFDSCDCPLDCWQGAVVWLSPGACLTIICSSAVLIGAKLDEVLKLEVGAAMVDVIVVGASVVVVLVVVVVVVVDVGAIDVASVPGL